MTKENILAKTHYGLKIYAHILRKYNKNQTIILVNQHRCKPVNNPFIPQKHPSLQFTFIDHQWVYHDIKHKKFKGDVFDFVRLHYTSTNPKTLLSLINYQLRLKLKPKVNPVISSYESNRRYLQKQLEGFPNDVYAPKFSYFKDNLYNLFATKKVGIPEVYYMLTDRLRKYRTEKLRSLSSKKEQSKFKRTKFDSVTFSGIFLKRENTSLIQHSGLLTIDIDDIKEESRLQQIKRKLLDDRLFSTELLFTSPRGKGLKWIISISLHSVTHRQYFTAVNNYLQETYDIAIDTSGSDVSRACILPYDPEASIHPKYNLHL